MSNSFTEATLDGATSVLNEQVWTFRRTAGLSSRVNTAQSNLIKKAITPTAASTTVIVQPNPSGKFGFPKTLLSASATQTPSLQQDRMYSLVTVSFTRDGSDPNFGSARVWFTGYQGSSTPVLMASGTTSPISFLCESTGETVVVSVQPVSPDGLSADLGFAISGTVTLSGVVSAPAAPTIAQSLTNTPTGYQFAFNFLTGLLTDVIANYRVYRNFSNTTSGATVILSVPQDTHSSSSSYVVQDNIGSQSAATYYYWVSAVNTSGLESSLTAAQSGAVANGGWIIPPQYGTTVVVDNANFEASTAIMPATGGPPGWIPDAATLSYETGSPYAGSQSLKVAAAVTSGGANTLKQWSCKPGDQFFISAAMKSDGTSNPQTILVFWDSSNNFIGLGTGTAAHGTGTSWSIDTGTTTAPAGAVYFYVRCANETTGGSGVCYFDQVLVDRMVDPTTTVAAKGSTPASLNLGFSYSATTTSITWSWSGISILRADGTTTAVTNGSQTITGLLASHSYGFYPYADDSIDGATTVRWVTMGTGSPAYAGSSLGTLVGAQAQNLQNCIPLSISVMQASTPASGSTGGTGGGSGGCLHEDMLVNRKKEDGSEKIRIGNIHVGDYLSTPTGFELVTNVRQRPCSTWLLIETDVDSILCTPSHPFTLVTGEMMRAETLSLSDFLQGTNQRVAAIQSISVVHKDGVKVSITVEPNHVFYAGNKSQLLAHNGATRS